MGTRMAQINAERKKGPEAFNKWVENERAKLNSGASRERDKAAENNEIAKISDEAAESIKYFNSLAEAAAQAVARAPRQQPQGRFGLF
jgi:hypothetical protein